MNTTPRAASPEVVTIGRRMKLLPRRASGASPQISVPPADPAALALERLRGDGALRARLGEEGRRRAYSVFSAEAMAKATLSVYREVLSCV